MGILQKEKKGIVQEDKKIGIIDDLGDLSKEKMTSKLISIND